MDDVRLRAPFAHAVDFVAIQLYVAGFLRGLERLARTRERRFPVVGASVVSVLSLSRSALCVPRRLPSLLSSSAVPLQHGSPPSEAIGIQTRILYHVMPV